MRSRLCSQIEDALGRGMRTPKDFEYLSRRIFARLKVMVSVSTLKRIWGYVGGEVEPRRATLDILARFLGYSDFDDFVRRAGTVERESAEVMSDRLSVESLHPGDRLLLTWLPDRECLVEYNGGSGFTVVESKGTRLQPDDTFRCSLFIDGEPLFIDDLTRPGHEPTAYVCGKRSGIRVELLN